MKTWKLSMTENIECTAPIVACIGYFDGLHIGHQELVNETTQLAKELNCESAIITFDPDPWVTIKGIHDVKHISSMSQRMKLAEKMGIQHFIVLDFTSEMSKLADTAFLDLLLQNIVLKGLICGFDFHYGAFGSGNINTLAQYANDRFAFKFVQSINDEVGKISSSRICDYIESGNVKDANQLLGYSYAMEAVVIHGKAQGAAKLGFPTANCEVSSEMLIPKRGVYVGNVILDGNTYHAMINVGHNPTFNERHMISIEAHILDFKENIYGKSICVEFIDYIREEKRFNGINELIMQLNQDVDTTKSYFDK